MMALVVELMLICDLGEVLHDGLEALMVGRLEAGFRFRLRLVFPVMPRLVLRLVLEDLVSQTALPCPGSGGRRGLSPLRTSVLLMVELMGRRGGLSGCAVKPARQQ